MPMRSMAWFSAQFRNPVRRFRLSVAANGAVEFALIAPLLFLLLFGTLQAGIVLGIAHSLEQMAADAGRYAVVGIGAAERRTLAERWLEREVEHYPLLRPARVHPVTHEHEGALVVTVSYDASYLPQLPFVGAVLAFPASLERSATLMIP